ncbi:MAG: response regulator [Spirochaetaceae bacterium]|jgi:CheY-like chemotaxis protein/HPt (histidine-containing phosphotransfer) domain-containing protein|nr:response regulator [Spirochaetaceae bacterium]
MNKTVDSAIYLIILFITIFDMALRFVNDKKLDALTKKAEAANKAKSVFLANMSHELRTPMNAVVGLAELMPADNLNGTQKTYLYDIRRMSKALLGIINDILDFSKIEAGKMDIIPVHFNLTSLFNDIVSICGFMARGKALEFKTYKDEALPDVVYGDELRIRQILINIINNAVKYTRSGYVYFKLAKETGADGHAYIVATVEDTGIGISNDDMPKLFGTFQRLDTNKNRVVSGTGLGLAITKHLLDILGGSIKVESEYKKGSIFTVNIPLIPGDPLKVEKETDISNFVVSRERSLIKILAVDDSPVNLTVIKGYLAEHNMDADTCGNGKEALFKIAHNKYDIVFLDHMMPEMDGVETAMRIRALDGEYYKKLPVVALSANAVSGSRELFINAGMNDFISKPIDANQLNNVLAKFLEPEKITVNYSVSANKLMREYMTDNEVIWSENDRKTFRELGLIDSIDAREGVARVGNRVADYFKVLRQFIGGVDENITKIKTALQNGDWTNHAILVHAYTGVLAIIGAKELPERARRLETAAKNIIKANDEPENREAAESLNENLKLCREETLPLCNAIEAIRDELMKTSLADETKPEKTPVSAEELKEKLAALKVACGLFKADDADNISAELEKAAFSDDVDADIADIRKLTAVFNFAAASAKIENLLEKL